MLKDFLEGKPLRHPVHPMLVHFPIGLFILSLILDLASLAFPSVPNLVRDSFYAMLVGVITALIAAVPGFVDYTDIRSDHPAKRTHLSFSQFMLRMRGKAWINYLPNFRMLLQPSSKIQSVRTVAFHSERERFESTHREKTVKWTGDCSDSVLEKSQAVCCRLQVRTIAHHNDSADDI